jgi:hypothetical protein
MKSFRFLIFLVFFSFGNYFTASSGITQSSSSNIISQIASNSSFSAINTSGTISSSKKTTGSVVNAKELKKTVNADAKKFGLKINKKNLAMLTGEESEEENFVIITPPNPDDNQYPEPNLNTIVHDTGFITLTKQEDYNDDSSNTIFSGEQQARIRVYIDFKRKILFGEVESKITLASGSLGTNTFVGKKKDITELPVTGELLHTIRNDGTPILPTDIDWEYPYEKHSELSIVKADGTMAPFYRNRASEKLAFKKNMSHHADGDGNVVVGAKFITASEFTPGTATASFEAAFADPDVDNVSDADFISAVVRYEGTATTTATKFKVD